MYAPSVSRTSLAHEIAGETGLKVSTVYSRLREGHSADVIRAASKRLPGVRVGAPPFDRLTIVRELHKRSSSGKKRFRCACACGNEVDVIGADLASGRTRSCGCLRAERSAARSLERTKDITSQTFNDLRVVRILPPDANGKRPWLCECLLCGRSRVVRAVSLKIGQVKHCGCARKGRQAEAARRRARRVDVFGERMTLDELTALSELTKQAILYRMKRGMTAGEAAFAPRVRIKPHNSLIPTDRSRKSRVR